MKRTNKKGFTIVELVVVIAIIAILAAVLIPTFSSLIKRANVSKDNQLVRNLNTALIADAAINGKHNDMQSALDAVAEAGYLVDRINKASAKDNEILWDQVNDVFCYLNDGKVEYIPSSVEVEKQLDKGDYRLWKIYDSVPALADQTYSIYLAGTDVTEEFTVKVGIDVGSNSGIAKINYTGTTTSKTDVRIRTNSASTTLTVNGYVDPSDNTKGDVVYHYGSAGALEITKCATGSYHENGKVAFAEIAKGRIVLESGSEIKHIHVDKKTDTSFDTVIIADNGAKELPAAITRDVITVAANSSVDVVTVVSSNGSEEIVKVYGDGTTATTEKTETQNTNVNSALGQLVLDNGVESKALSSEAKTEAQKQIVDTAVYQEKIDIISTKWTGETVELVKVTRNWIKNDGYVLPYGTEYVSGFGKNHPAESEEEFNTYYNNAVSFATMVETTLSGKFYLDTNEKTIHVCGADCLQYLYLLDDYLSAKNQITCKETKYPFNVFYNAEAKGGWEIKVDNDIDLGGKIENETIINNWTPVNSQLTVDFQGHKVTNLVTDRYIVADGSITETSGASGLFGFTGGQIKNLVLENVTILNLSESESSYAGAIAGNIASGIFNCKVINANITSSKYVGGIAGMGYGAIENCTIENSTITGGYKLGGLIGQSSNSGNGFDYKNNTLNNVTIQLDRTLCSEETAYVVGKLIGYLQNNSTITGNTLTNVSIKVSGESGYVDLTDEIDIHKGSSGSEKSNDENGLVGIFETKYAVSF